MADLKHLLQGIDKIVSHYFENLDLWKKKLEEAKEKERIKKQQFELDSKNLSIPNHFQQYLPLYFDPVAIERYEFEFNTLEELLAYPDINEMREFYEKQHDDKFYRFSLWDDHLIMEFNEGESQQTVGFVRFPNRLDLPITTAKLAK
jgi:hypothetical protein